MKHIKLIVIFLVILLLLGATILIKEKDSIIKIMRKTKENDIEFSYRLVEDKDEKFKILIEVKDENIGIDIIKLPNGDTIECRGKRVVGIDYEVQEKTDYIFIARNMEGTEKTERLNLIIPNKPVIEVKNIGIPVLTLSDVELPKIEIKYDEREDFENYYSIDDGKTWNKYTGPISATKRIKAKSENKKCRGISSEASQIAITGEDTKAIGINAYDDYIETAFSMSTYPNPSETYMLLDESGWNQELNIVAAYSSQSSWVIGDSAGAKMVFLNGEDQVIGNIIHLANTDVGSTVNIDKNIKIPENSKKIKIYYTIYQGPFVIYDISIVNTPKIKRKPQYAKITNNRIESSYSIASIEYFPLSKEKLYKIDDGEWKIYEGNIKVNGNETIYAKGIDENGKETKVQSLKCDKKLDTLSNLAFDNDNTTYDVLNTYPNSGKFYIEIDSSAIGKKLDFNISNVYYSALGNGASINFVNDNFDRIQNIATLSNYGENFSGKDIEIPATSKYLEISISGYGGPVTVYEINVKD